MLLGMLDVVLEILNRLEEEEEVKTRVPPWWVAVCSPQANSYYGTCYRMRNKIKGKGLKQIHTPPGTPSTHPTL